jgi:hypothetical protein
MSKLTKKRKKLKSFDVSYCIEQGFCIRVRATSDDNAERAVRRRLDEACDVLPNSERVHYDGFIASCSEVRS